MSTGVNVQKPSAPVALDHEIGALNLGVDTPDFLRRYWQKRPKLMRQALRNFGLDVERQQPEHNHYEQW